MTGLKIGAHLSVAGGLARTLAEAKRLRLEALQVFSGNPRSFKAKAIDPEEADSFRAGLSAAGIGPLIIHAPYLLNLASPDEENWLRSRQMLAREMERGSLLGATALVFHPGSHLKSGLEAGLRRVAEAMRAALDEGPAGVILAVENMAGSGSGLGGRLEELAAVLDACGSEWAAVWLDTAHAFEAGYDLSRPEGADAWIERAASLFGLERVIGLHINDSLTALGSRVDRHTHLGQGLIGGKGLSRILAHPRLEGKPGILETPRSSEGDDRRNLATARRLRTLGLKSRRPR